MAQNNDNNEKKDNGLNIVAIIEDFIGKIRDFKIVDLIKLLISFLSKIKLKLIIIGITIGSIVLIILAVITWGTVKEIFDKVKETFTDINNKVTIVDNNIEIDQAYWQEAEQKLRQMGVSTTSLGLNGDEELLQKILEAEIVTYFPYLGGDDLQGTVYFERATVDGNKTELQYISKDDFYNRLNSGDSSLINYFTLDEEDWTVHVIKNSNEGINQNNVEKIDYRSMVNKYAMPFEFPLALALITQNPNFILAVIDLAQESRMVVTIAESKVVTNTVIRESYVETKTVTNRETGELLDEYTTSRRVEQIVDEYEEVEYSTQILLSSVRAWVANQVTDLTPPSAEVYEAEPIVNSFPNESSNTIATMENSGIPLLASQNGNFNLHTEQTDKRQRTEVTTTSYIWKVGVTSTEEKFNKFMELLINDNAAIGGSGGLVEIAKNCHDYLSENGYKYATPGGHHFPDTGSKTIDCSAYVSWVLREAGYDDIGMQSSESLPNVAEQKGWFKIDNMEDLQPGDICFYDGHVNIFVKRDGENYLFYDCGSDTAIAAKDPIVYDAEGRGFKFAYRLNDEIAQKLSVNTPEALEESIENYISTIKFGDWSVSVRNSKGTEEISINNSQQTSDGFLKLFIMAATYNEVKEGNLEEDVVTPYIERMMEADSNEATNELILLIGNQDTTRGLEIINEYIDQNGYSYTNIGSSFNLENETYSGDESNYTSVRGVTGLLQAIYNKTCVNRDYSKKMLEMINMNQTFKELIPSTIEDGTVYNKQEELSNTLADSAIIEIGRVKYIVAIKGIDLTNKDEAREVIKSISSMIYQYYNSKRAIQTNDNDKIDTVMDGNRVCYWVPDQSAYVSPLTNLIDDGSGMLFELLASSEKTQNHEVLMRYILYKITGKSYGVTEYSIEDFFSNGGLDGTTIGSYFGDWNGGTHEEFIQAVAPYAVVDMQQHQIYASVTIAQAIIESGWGQDEIALKYKNFFGMKGKQGSSGNEFWSGEVVVLNASEGGKATFRVYDSLKNSIYDHGRNFHVTATYKAHGVLECIANNLGPREQAKRIQESGYAQNSSYADLLYSIIQSNDLEKYDSMTVDDFEQTSNVQSGVIGDGYDQVYTLGSKSYKEFKQSRGSYKSIKYWSGTISSSGCGPTAAAIVLSGYGKNVTPKDTAMYMSSHGNITSASTLQEVIKNFGIQCHSKYGVTAEDLINNLRQGRPVIISVNSNRNGMFTNNGHIMALLDINDKNEIYVSNPNPSKAGGWVKIDDIIACSSSKYAVYIDQ